MEVVLFGKSCAVTIGEFLVLVLSQLPSIRHATRFGLAHMTEVWGEPAYVQLIANLLFSSGENKITSWA